MLHYSFPGIFGKDPLLVENILKKKKEPRDERETWAAAVKTQHELIQPKQSAASLLLLLMDVSINIFIYMYV